MKLKKGLERLSNNVFLKIPLLEVLETLGEDNFENLFLLLKKARDVWANTLSRSEEERIARKKWSDISKVIIQRATTYTEVIKTYPHIFQLYRQDPDIERIILQRIIELASNLEEVKDATKRVDVSRNFHEEMKFLLLEKITRMEEEAEKVVKEFTIIHSKKEGDKK